MTLPGLLSSPSQRRSFLVTSGVIILLVVLLILVLFHSTPDTRAWNLVINALIAFASSSIFAIAVGLYMTYCFDDPFELASANRLLPKDIGQALTEMAGNAMEYKLMVRTGRHFRAEVLPVLVSNATKHRRPVTIEAILLDFRDDKICGKYASYRRSSSFDRHNWSKRYVQKEIIATILKLIQTKRDHSTLIRINLYLSTRLSTFRFDGSHDQVIVTREDPADIASRYHSSDNEFSAYLNEFNWTREDAFEVKEWPAADTPFAALQMMFDTSDMIPELETDARTAINDPSPYVR